MSGENGQHILQTSLDIAPSTEGDLSTQQLPVRKQQIEHTLVLQVPTEKVSGTQTQPPASQCQKVLGAWSRRDIT